MLAVVKVRGVYFHSHHRVISIFTDTVSGSLDETVDHTIHAVRVLTRNFFYGTVTIAAAVYRLIKPSSENKLSYGAFSTGRLSDMYHRL